jgi:uncharacterized protein
MPLMQRLPKQYHALLLDIARQSIANGLRCGKPLDVDLAAFPSAFSDLRATFVTLERQNKLRGCIGKLEATYPLVRDVVENAYSAAFLDRRFQPVNQEEYPDLAVHISILSPLDSMVFSSESQLIAQLRPDTDGLILEDRRQRATFLPAVWESIESPEEFVKQLKIKAGFAAGYWSATMKAYRYTVENIG